MLHRVAGPLVNPCTNQSSSINNRLTKGSATQYNTVCNNARNSFDQVCSPPEWIACNVAEVAWDSASRNFARNLELDAENTCL